MLTARTSRPILGVALRGVPIHTRAPVSISCSRAIVQQIRASSFLNDNSIPSRSRKPQTTARESWFSRRRKQRNARSKISTLALDSQMMGVTGEHPLAQEPVEQLRRTEGQDKSESTKKGRLSPATRRLVILCTILSIPVWGRDILEAVVPGLLGVFIFVASNIKKGITWVKSPFDRPKPVT